MRLTLKFAVFLFASAQGLVCQAGETSAQVELIDETTLEHPTSLIHGVRSATEKAPRDAPQILAKALPAARYRNQTLDLVRASIAGVDASALDLRVDGLRPQTRSCETSWYRHENAKLTFGVYEEIFDTAYDYLEATEGEAVEATEGDAVEAQGAKSGIPGAKSGIPGAKSGLVRGPKSGLVRGSKGGMVRDDATHDALRQLQEDTYNRLLVSRLLRERDVSRFTGGVSTVPCILISTSIFTPGPPLVLTNESR